MPKPALCLKTPKQQGEKNIATARKLALIDTSLEIQRDQGSLYIPLVRQPNEEESVTLKHEAPESELETEF